VQDGWRALGMTSVIGILSIPMPGPRIWAGLAGYCRWSRAAAAPGRSTGW